MLITFVPFTNIFSGIETLLLPCGILTEYLSMLSTVTYKIPRPVDSAVKLIFTSKSCPAFNTNTSRSDDDNLADVVPTVPAL